MWPYIEGQQKQMGRDVHCTLHYTFVAGKDIFIIVNMFKKEEITQHCTMH